MSPKFGLLAALFVMAVPAMATAQDTMKSDHMMSGQKQGFYVGAGGGVNLNLDSDLSGTGINTTADYDTGWAGVGSLGYAFGNGFRLELEGGYRDNDVDSFSGASSASGDASALSIMGNVLYDFNTGTAFTPYIGAGVGGARIDYDGFSPVGSTSINDDDTVFAYQGIAGVSYNLSPQAQIFADYRYFATQDPEFNAASGVGVDGEYASHTVLVGVRFFFGGPKPKPKPMMKKAEPAPPPPPPAPEPKKMAEPAPPPPPPSPSPAVPQSYLVFFDWDQSVLTPEALRIVRAAAANAEKGGVTRIEATGHADRSGPASYNMGLSRRRAQSVMAELIKQGVPKNEIAVFAKGETDPLVPTPDGVREPQNRRVEIVFK
jgi:outer membrane protein OmpA-like peptidoglycan-associated protein